MANANIYNTHELVERLLECYPSTRNSDNTLYLMVVKEINPDVLGMSFTVVMSSIKKLGLPQFETVRRSRQKIQSDRPELCSSPDVLDEKYELFKEFKDYAIS